MVSRPLNASCRTLGFLWRLNELLSLTDFLALASLLHPPAHSLSCSRMSPYLTLSPCRHTPSSLLRMRSAAQGPNAAGRSGASSRAVVIPDCGDLWHIFINDAFFTVFARCSDWAVFICENKSAGTNISLTYFSHLNQTYPSSAGVSNRLSGSSYIFSNTVYNL